MVGEADGIRRQISLDMVGSRFCHGWSIFLDYAIVIEKVVLWAEASL